MKPNPKQAGIRATLQRDICREKERKKRERGREGERERERERPRLWRFLFTCQDAQDVMNRLTNLHDAFFGIDDKHRLAKTQHVYYVREQNISNDDDESLQLSGHAGVIGKAHAETECIPSLLTPGRQQASGLSEKPDCPCRSDALLDALKEISLGS